MRALASIAGSSAPRFERRFDRIDDGVIAGTAAVVAREDRWDVVTGYAPALLEQLGGGDQHARRAVAALERVALDEIRLQIGDFAGLGEPLYGDHFGPVGLHRQHQATANDRAIHPYRAGPANAVLAAD